MIQIEIANCKLSNLEKTPLHYVASISLTLQKLQTTKEIPPNLALYKKILTREQDLKKWCQIHLTTSPPWGRNPLSIYVQSSPVINSYDTEQDVVGHTFSHLSKCFCLAYSVPFYCGQLFDDLGFMGDTYCAQQILKGTYDYPPDTNIWTKKILQEAHYTFSQMSSAETATTITTKDF